MVVTMSKQAHTVRSIVHVLVNNRPRHGAQGLRGHLTTRTVGEILLAEGDGSSTPLIKRVYGVLVCTRTRRGSGCSPRQQVIARTWKVQR